jgi:hypothetical protein
MIDSTQFEFTDYAHTRDASQKWFNHSIEANIKPKLKLGNENQLQAQCRRATYLKIILLKHIMTLSGGYPL